MLCVAFVFELDGCATSKPQPSFDVTAISSPHRFFHVSADAQRYSEHLFVTDISVRDSIATPIQLDINKIFLMDSL
jgi:hypothetical protein